MTSHYPKVHWHTHTYGSSLCMSVAVIQPSSLAATIEKFAKEYLPSDVRISGPGLELLLECCSGEASGVLHKQQIPPDCSLTRLRQSYSYMTTSRRQHCQAVPHHTSVEEMHPEGGPVTGILCCFQNLYSS